MGAPVLLQTTFQRFSGSNACRHTRCAAGRCVPAGIVVLGGAGAHGELVVVADGVGGSVAEGGLQPAAIPIVRELGHHVVPAVLDLRQPVLGVVHQRVAGPARHIAVGVVAVAVAAGGRHRVGPAGTVAVRPDVALVGQVAEAIVLVCLAVLPAAPAADAGAQ